MPLVALAVLTNQFVLPTLSDRLAWLGLVALVFSIGSLGRSLPLFNQAERALRKGELRPARRLYCRFLLRSGELEDQAGSYLVRARERLAEILEAEYRKAAPEVPEIRSEPEAYFDE